jgi:hypothetical protein
VNSYTQSPYPFFEGEFTYTSDTCGKIGPWQMLFSLSGFYGWDKQIYATQSVTNTLCPACPPFTGKTAYQYSDDLEVAWGAAFKAFIPIIPERKGDKGGALSVSGILFMSHNPSWYMGPLTVGAYNTGTSTNPDYKYPKITGGWGQVTYFFTDKLFMSGWYGYMSYNMSKNYKNQVASNGQWINNNNVQSETQYIVNLSYDVNPAMRLGLEWDYIKTTYANAGTPIPTTPPSAPNTGYYAGKTGSLNAFRIGAWYFF